MEDSMRELSRYRYENAKEASENREKADYLDFFIASKEEAEKQIKRAEEFVAVIGAFLKDKGVIS